MKFHYVSLQCTALHYNTTRHNTTQHIDFQYVASRCVTLRYVYLHCVAHFTGDAVTFHRTMLRYITSHYAAFHYNNTCSNITLRNTTHYVSIRGIACHCIPSCGTSCRHTASRRNTSWYIALPCLAVLCTTPHCMALYGATFQHTTKRANTVPDTIPDRITAPIIACHCIAPPYIRSASYCIRRAQTEDNTLQRRAFSYIAVD